MTTADSTIKRLFDDLLNLEVNLIFKADMTARKMELTTEPFHDIASQYADCIAAMARVLEISVQLSDIPDDEISATHFTTLSQNAANLRRINRERADEQGEFEGRDVLLKRIERNSQQLAWIMKQHGVPEKKDDGRWQPLKIASKDDLLTLRKAWEVGTESVVMQTVAQVDGDIVTRIQRARSTANDAPVHSVQMKLVATSLEHWRFLFATLATFTLGVFTTFFQS
jgi:hypothetical protein